MYTCRRNCCGSRPHRFLPISRERLLRRRRCRNDGHRRVESRATLREELRDMTPWTGFRICGAVLAEAARHGDDRRDRQKDGRARSRKRRAARGSEQAHTGRPDARAVYGRARQDRRLEEALRNRRMDCEALDAGHGRHPDREDCQAHALSLAEVAPIMSAMPTTLKTRRATSGGVVDRRASTVTESAETER